MLTIDPKEIAVSKLHHYLLGAVGPRPIAFASTIDADGNENLAPFSFFNVFSASPPILIFSPARSGRTNTTFRFTVEGVEMPIVLKYKYLGVVLSASGRWADLLEEVERNTPPP